MARNQDDHTKNHSFIMNRSGEWSLAPAYDICFAYSPSGQWTNRHQLSVNNKRDNFALSDILAVAENADITKPRKIVQEIAETVSRWRQYAREAGVYPQHIDLIDKTLRL